MSNLAIRRALLTHLAAMTPDLPTAVENETFTPPAADLPYQRASLLPAEPRNPEQGGFIQRQGVFSVVLAYPEAMGAGPGQERAEAVEAHFPRNLTLGWSGLSVKVRYTPTIAPGFSEGDRYMIPVSIRYDADVTG